MNFKNFERCKDVEVRPVTLRVSLYPFAEPLLLTTSGQTAVLDNPNTDSNCRSFFVQTPGASASEVGIVTGERCLIVLKGHRAERVGRGTSTDLLKVRAFRPGVVHLSGGLMGMWYLLLPRTWQSM